MLETLLFNVKNNIATISFNRPRAMNSFDKKMADELASVTDEVRNDATIRAVLLNGTGNLFMAGGDIRFFYEKLDHMPADVMMLVRTLNVTILNIMQMSKPVLASVHGSVAGVGMSFMMACDLVIAAESTKFTMAYSGLGISPDGGASYNLPRMVGVKRAMEWMFFPDLIDATTAKNAGLINWITSDDKLTQESEKILNRLANGPSKSYAKIKKLVNQAWDVNLETQLECEGRAFEACSATTDFKNGVKAFLNKEKPVFVGE